MTRPALGGIPAPSRDQQRSRIDASWFFTSLAQPLCPSSSLIPPSNDRNGLSVKTTASVACLRPGEAMSESPAPRSKPPTINK